MAATNFIEVNGINVSADTLRVAQMMTEGKLILRTIQPRVKKEKTDKAICPCAVPIVSIRVASDAIQRQYPKDGSEVPTHLGIYIVSHDKIDRAYKKCTRPLLVDKESKEVRDYCYKHWETHLNASANLYLFDDIVKTGRLATTEDPFFQTAKQTGRKKKDGETAAATGAAPASKRGGGAGASGSGEKQKLLDIRIPLTPEIFAKLKKFQEMAGGSVSKTASSNDAIAPAPAAAPTPAPAPVITSANPPTLEIKPKPIANNNSPSLLNDPNISKESEDGEDGEDDAAEEADDAEEADAADGDDADGNDAEGDDDAEEEEVDAEDITTTTGEALSLVESTMTVYRSDEETGESDEIGVMVEVDSKTKKHAVTYKDKKYIIGVPQEHDDVEYYRCVITDQLFPKQMPATLAGKVKKNAKGDYVPTLNAKK